MTRTVHSFIFERFIKFVLYARLFPIPGKPTGSVVALGVYSAVDSVMSAWVHKHWCQ